MRRGAVVEMGATERVFGNPLHPYTKTLLASVPQLHTKWKDVEAELPRRRARRRAAALPAAAASSSRSRTTTSSRPSPTRPRSWRHDDAQARSPATRLRASRGRSARPARATSLWRSSRNPIIPRDHIPRANSIFNSAVVPFGDGFAGVFRVDDTRRVMNLHAGRSADGVDWEIDAEPIAFEAGRPARRARSAEPFEHAYDPRVTWLEDRYYVTWCNGYHGPTIGVGYTHDFETFHQLDNAFLPFNRNGVLFPRRIGDRYAMLSRPSDNGHTPFGEIFYSESPDLVHWGRHRHVMAPRAAARGSRRRSAPARRRSRPTRAGSLLYHGVLTSLQRLRLLDGRGAARPRRAVAGRRARQRLPARRRRCSYEQVGDVPNVVFPCAALVDRAADRVTIYYGGADTVVCLAHAHLSELLAFVRG